MGQGRPQRARSEGTVVGPDAVAREVATEVITAMTLHQAMQQWLEDGSWITATTSDDLASGDTAVAEDGSRITVVPTMTLHLVMQQWLEDGSWVTGMPNDDLASGDAAVAEDGSRITALPSDDLASGDAAMA